jgi:hypothetical protein
MRARRGHRPRWHVAFFGRLGDFTCWLGVLRYKYAYGACFFEKKCFFFGCTEAPYTGGSKKLYLALDLKRKKKKKKKKKEEKRARKKSPQ